MNSDANGKPKVVIVNEKLMDYRIPIYNILAEKYDLTFVYSYPLKAIANDVKFKLVQISTPKKLGPIFLHSNNILKICNQFDAAIVLGEIRRVMLAALPFSRRKFKMAFWTIGVSTAHGLDARKGMDWLRDYIYRHAEGCVFYTEFARERAIKKGYRPESLFVANNTVEVLPIKDGIKKDSFLFMGTLYKLKGFPVLLEAYKQANKVNPALPILNIVGGGVEYDNIKKWIEQEGLQHKVFLIGPVYDKELKREYFQRAYACISPKQAGLSVLEAMGYGVPFVTMHDAITGGERLNIHDGIDGILMKQESELCDILVDIARSPSKYEKMGKNAYEYYWTERKPERMAQGLSDAIEYLLSLK